MLANIAWLSADSCSQRLHLYTISDCVLELEIEFVDEFIGLNPDIGEVFKSETPLSQLHVTQDNTDYMWYHTVVEVTETEVRMLCLT